MNVIGGGIEAKTGCSGLVAETQVPRGVYSFRLSSSTPPLNGDLRVDLSRGLQGEINSSNPFYLKNQDLAKIFLTKRSKTFFSKIKTSETKYASKFAFIRVTKSYSFSFVFPLSFSPFHFLLLPLPISLLH